MSETLRSEAQPVAQAQDKAPRYGLEVLAVLGVSFGMSGINALLSFIHDEIVVPGGIANSTQTIVSGAQTSYQVLDIAFDLADVLSGLMPPFLALVLLLRDPGVLTRTIGLPSRQRGQDFLTGAGFAALIGIPGLALVYTAHRLGVSAQLAVVSVPDEWYRVPLLLLQAAQNGIAEEVVVVAYLLTRLRQMGWTDSRALGASAVLRGSYHLYQGLGGFFGNMVMGVIFGWWFQRTRRVLPLIVAHTLIDAFSFVGYVYLHNHVSWI